MFQKEFCATIAIIFCLCMADSLFAEEKKPFTNSIGMKFVYIPPGTFMMGSPENEPGRGEDETLHKVTLTKGFYMQTTEVTQSQWRVIMGNNPSDFKDCGDNCPVENVSWNDVQTFIIELNKKEGSDKYRLPTEAEWEYAARGGTTTPFSFGNCLSTSQANYYGYYPIEGCSKGIYRDKTVSVGSFSPNARGLYDMHGNVMEWVDDIYTDKGVSISTDSGPSRIIRGGGWNFGASYCRSASRFRGKPVVRGYSIGFRLVRSE